MLSESQYTVSSSPHIKHDEDTRSIMLDVCVALVFPLLVSFYLFGLRAVIVSAISAAACVFFEWGYRKLLKKPSSVRDLSAVVTGLLLAFNLPASVPYWIPVIGAFFAIVVVKQLYGGIGKNFLNPALAGRVFLFIAFSDKMGPLAYTAPLSQPSLPLWGAVDAVSQATPLAYLSKGVLPSTEFTLREMFLGLKPGSLGEVSAVILLLAGLYLVVRRVISPRIPLLFIGTVAVFSFAFPQGGASGLDWMLYQVLSGGLLLGAIFMATDYTTCPVTVRGQVLFAVGCGLLTVFMRTFGSYPEGVSFAILIMNACVWLFEKAGKPRRFGTGLGKTGGESHE